jgi:hypothetical protein
MHAIQQARGDISGVKKSQVQVTATTSGLELSPAALIRTALSVSLTMSLLNVDHRDGVALGREANAMRCQEKLFSRAAPVVFWAAGLRRVDHG